MTYTTLDQLRQIHEEWKQSGLSVQQYCVNTGLKEGRFYYWRSKMQAESQPATCGSFIPVKMSGKSSWKNRVCCYTTSAERNAQNQLNLAFCSH